MTMTPELKGAVERLTAFLAGATHLSECNVFADFAHDYSCDCGLDEARVTAQALQRQQDMPGRESVYAFARAFVTEQSEGEWGDDLIERDAVKLTDQILSLWNKP